jgi:hypothetical protein
VEIPSHLRQGDIDDAAVQGGHEGPQADGQQYGASLWHSLSPAVLMLPTQSRQVVNLGPRLPPRPLEIYPFRPVTEQCLGMVQALTTGRPRLLIRIRMQKTNI